MKNIFLIISILYITNSFSQHKEISYEGYSYLRAKGFKISVIELQNDILIDVRVLDSVSDKINDDRQYKRYMKQLRKLSSAEMQDVRILQKRASHYNKIFYKYVYIKSDSLTISKSEFVDYFKEYTKIFETPINVLENKDSVRIVLDGHINKFKIRSNSNQVVLHLQSLNKLSHPILFNFLKQTLYLYRAKRGDSFLKPEYTFGN